MVSLVCVAAFLVCCYLIYCEWCTWASVANVPEDALDAVDKTEKCPKCSSLGLWDLAYDRYCDTISQTCAGCGYRSIRSTNG